MGEKDEKLIAHRFYIDIGIAIVAILSLILLLLLQLLQPVIIIIKISSRDRASVRESIELLGRGT